MTIMVAMMHHPSLLMKILTINMTMKMIMTMTMTMIKINYQQRRRLPILFAIVGGSPVIRLLWSVLVVQAIPSQIIATKEVV